MKNNHDDQHNPSETLIILEEAIVRALAEAKMLCIESDYLHGLAEEMESVLEETCLRPAVKFGLIHKRPG